jgi:putative endonuclease
MLSLNYLKGIQFFKTEAIKMAKAWVYILRCADGAYYTGYTTNLEKRLAEHQSGEGSEWTRHRLPVELVFTQEMPDEDHAFRAE